MKARKTLFAIGASAIASIALLIGVASAVENKPKIFNGFADASHSFVLTSSDFTAASGNFEKCGVSFHYDNASVSDGIVSIAAGRIYNTLNHHSGSSKSAEGMRGNGFTRVVFSDFSKVLDGADGTVVYTKAGSTDEAKATVSFTEDIDLTISGTVEAKNRTRVHFEGANDTFKFRTITFYYDCTVSTPSVEITGTSNSFGVGETSTLTAHPYETFSDPVTYSWTSSNDAIASIAANSDTAVVTGKSAGDATITCTMTVGGNNYSNTYDVTITEELSLIKHIEVLSDTRWEGAGFFGYFNPSSVGLTYDQIRVLPLEFSTTSSVIGNGTKVSYQQSTTNTKTCFYMNGFTVPSNTEKYTMTYTFTDSSVSPNIKYEANFYFDGTTLLLGANISGDDSVNIDESINLTANYTLSGDVASYNWSADNDRVNLSNTTSQVVSVEGNTAGFSLIKLELVASDKIFVVTKSIEIVDPSAQYSNIPILNTTRVVGAQIFFIFNPSTLGITNSNKDDIVFSDLNTIVITKTGDSPNDANPYITGGTNEITLAGTRSWAYVNENEALLYINLSAGVPDNWKLQFVLTYGFEFGGTNYRNTLTFVGGVLTSVE